MFLFKLVLIFYYRLAFVCCQLNELSRLDYVNVLTTYAFKLTNSILSHQIVDVIITMIKSLTISFLMFAISTRFIENILIMRHTNAVLLQECKIIAVLPHTLVTVDLFAIFRQYSKVLLKKSCLS